MIDSLLLKLDEVVADRGVFLQEKEQQIAEIKEKQKKASSNEERYGLYGELFEVYKNYQMDSALFVANARIKTAEMIDNPRYQLISSMNLAEVMIGTGMYKEAFDLLDNQSREIQTIDVLTYRYHLYHSLYVLMMDYSISEKQKEEYKQLSVQYKDSILSVLSDDQIGWHMVSTTRLLAENRTEEALEMGLACYSRFGVSNQSIAMSAYTLAEVCRQMGNREEEKKYLAISALGDLRGAVKEYISLRDLALMLYEDGDIARAYDYTKCAMEDAIFCNARLRALEISQILPIINESYDLKMQREKDRLASLLGVISLLSLFLMGALLYIYKQLKALSVTRKRLKQSNSDLEIFNANLNKLNRELSESNLVKEEYIGYVFSMCSAYIDKMEDFRKKTNRKLRAGQIEELLRNTSSSSLVSDELKEFHLSFDTIFLKLYPTFIDEFNSLLLPEEAVVPREGDLLTPELRIFALVRLGISDSAKIADFLHYSTQTVYNYRLKVRNKSRLPKDEFSDAVNRIGRIVM
ncbi:DUF6377 domain-containing protein [Massilibacteroides vaginae]|uniref:DUF6377 domain-containing protein n=1 Tax=Massilibacteroides vaginae TaxID=1673718 RepID=UPI001FE65BA4|nr:DUF6377 domain-containing protein [Massilibacteroides vaginae]